VTFGSTPATFSVNSEANITTTAPAAGAGTVPVTVTTVAGTASAPQQFTYSAPPTPTPVVTVVPPRTCKVPNLHGRKLKGAKNGLRKADCKVGKLRKKKGVTAKDGKVVKQTPKAGTVVPAGSRVAVKLG
jgi:hypothetical protein